MFSKQIKINKMNKVPKVNLKQAKIKKKKKNKKKNLNQCKDMLTQRKNKINVFKTNSNLLKHSTEAKKQEWRQSLIEEK